MAITVKATVATWLAEDVSPPIMAEANDVFLKIRMTKCEVLCMRAIRDSRKKAEHLKKYVAAFVQECDLAQEGKKAADCDDWKLYMFPELAAKVSSIVAQDNAELSTPMQDKATS